MTAPEPDRLPPGAGAGTGLLVALVLGGIGVGLAIAVTAGGGTQGALFIGIFTLPLALGAGFTAWHGILGAWLIGGLGRSLFRARGNEDRFRDESRRSLESIRAAGLVALPGTWVVVPAAVVVGVIAAFLMGVAAAENGFLAGLLLLVATTAYGVLLRRLARSGRLLFPE